MSGHEFSDVDRDRFRRGPKPSLTFKDVARKLGVTEGYATMLMATQGNSDAKKCRRFGCKALMFAHEGALIDSEFCADHRGGSASAGAPDRQLIASRAHRLAALKAKYGH
jgi:hypothetical protein